MSADQTNYEAIMTALNAIADWMGRIDAKLDALAGHGMSDAYRDMCNERPEGSTLSLAARPFAPKPKPQLKAIDGGKSMQHLADAGDDMA